LATNYPNPPAGDNKNILSGCTGRAGNELWATGGWIETIQVKNFGPIPIKGYWSVLREGEDWKIRMLTWNITPAPPAETK
jgi:hypothetical protein